MAAPGYQLVWSDEFDTPGLPSPVRWRYDTDRNREGWWNDEAQYYAANRRENARVENGHLVIEARHESAAALPDNGRQGYTSARLLNAGPGWRYGMFEVRAKLPCGRGSWPAIWLLPDAPAPGWPAGGEIDVMEHVGHEPGTIYANVHTGASVAVGTPGPNGTSLPIPSACGDFHRYQLRWTADAIEIGVDGRTINRYANDGRGDNATWPFGRPFHLILNVAVGGEWGGQKGIDDAAFPQAMEVDYVRVWQRPGE